MVALLTEFRTAKGILEEEKAKLVAEGVAVADDIEVGIMIEIPAAAMLADQFAKEVDFFSIGTNDLIQYTMAADRMNEQVSYLYQPYNPSILRLINNVIKAAHAEGKWLVCVVKWPVTKLLFHFLLEWAWMSSQCQRHLFFVHVA